VGDSRLILRMSQVRQPARAVWMGLSAGGVDERDASLEVAALRELREETGHRGRLRRIGGIFLAPGYSEEYQHIFLAEELAEDALDSDEDEDLQLERLTLEEALAAVDREEIRDAKSIAALLMYVRAVRSAPAR